MQTQINSQLANGVVGEFYDDSPKKVDTYIMGSASRINVVGAAFTVTSQGVANVGGAGAFAGLLVNPKQYANYEVDLGATNVAHLGSQASLSKMGRIWADVQGVANVGDTIFFDDTTGILGVGTAAEGQTQVPNCKVFYYDATANGLCVLELLN